MHNGEDILSPAVRRLAVIVAKEIAAAAADPDTLPQLPPVTSADLQDAEYTALRWACLTALEHGDPIDPPSVTAGADATIVNPALRARITQELVEAFCAVVADPDKQPDPTWCKPMGPLTWIPPDDSERWLVEDLLLRGEPQLLAGPPKSGKTWFGFALAIAAATGTGILGWRNPKRAPARVLCISLEDSDPEARARLSQLLLGSHTAAAERFEAERLLAQNLALSTMGVRFPESASLSKCVKECRAWKPEVVIVDNLTRVFDGNPNSAQDAAAVTNVWADLSRELHAAIVMLHHTSKPAPNETRDRFDRIRGSGDFLAVARNTLLLERIGESDVFDLGIRGNRQLRRDRAAVELVHTPSQHLDGWLASAYADRGDPEAMRDQLQAERDQRRRKASSTKRQADEKAAWVDRCAAVDAILLLGSHVSSSSLALKLGVSKATAVRHLAQMAGTGMLVRDGNDGYRRPDE